MHDMKQNNYVTIHPFNGRTNTVGCHVFCFQPLMQLSPQGRLMFMSDAEIVWKNTVRKQGEVNCGFAMSECCSYNLLKQQQLVV
jgi:hypothetical protein